jgi:hypothetical protein
MATITTDTFLDGGTARTAGEVWTNNGGRLTVRTDTRWHANAPASMTGTLGNVTISSSLGGGYTLDGRNVRWMPYNTGTGNVPAIGTAITQGGVSGYLLGVWASLTAAPTAVGAAVPATGFIKFREVTGGPFAAGALTGIGASATGSDVVGWIEVVHDQATAITVPRLGDFTVRGDWFDLGTTTGAANQLVQIPTNGSTTAYVPGVWISTVASPTTDAEWEFYPAIYAAAMISANLSTDARSKFVCMETDGRVRIGHNGTAAICHVPAAGMKIRIPNVLGRQCTTAARSTNVIPSATAGTRPDFTTTNAGVIDIEHFATDWFLSFSQPFSVKAYHVATFDYLLLAEVASPLDIFDGGNGISQSLDSRTLSITSCFAGGTVQKWTCHRHAAGTTDHAFEVLYSSGIEFYNIFSGIVTYARSSGYPFQITQSSGLNFENCVQFNGPMTFTTCFDCTVYDLDHVDRYVGTTNATTGVYVVSVGASSNNITVDGVTFGLNGAIANCHPYLGVFNAGLSKNIKFRNLGSRAAFANGGSANQPANIYVSSGNNLNVKVQRCYMTPTRTGALSTTNSDKSSVYEHVYGDFADTITLADLNSHAKNCGGTNTVTGQASVYGTMFWDAFTSNTAGRLVLQMNEATTETAAYQTLVAGTPQFTSAGSLVLNNVGDEVQWEMDYWCLGVTAFANAVPVVTGTNVTFSSGSRWGNHDLYFQVDKGAGYGGSWINFNQTNLAAETGIDPAVGFKIKFRAVCAIASTTNLLTYVRFDLTSSLAAQTNNLYPLDTATIQVTGLVTGSRVKATKISNGDVLFNGAETSGAVSFQTDFIGAILLEARKASSAPFYQPWVTQVTSVADTITVAAALQVLDE